MTQKPRAIPAGVGPHEGIEFDLMRCGEKHIALFLEIQPDGLSEMLKDSRFAHFGFTSPVKNGIAVQVWIVFRKTYYQDAIAFRKLYEETTISPWSRAREREIGRYLGYRVADVETFIHHAEALRKKRG